MNDESAKKLTEAIQGLAKQVEMAWKNLRPKEVRPEASREQTPEPTKAPASTADSREGEGR